MEDLTGKQFGPYRVVSPIGAGGMGEVYKAYQPGIDRHVALKILPRHFAHDPQFVGRFRQEAKVLASLQHPHILPIHDFGEADGYTYIVMPLVSGGTLAGLLQGQPLPFDRVHRIIAQLGDALDYAHSRGLVHRDIKPSNVLLDERGNCLLMDFGLAKILEGTQQFTTTGGILGTPSYMSPEQGLGKTLDRRSDIYSLGVVLYKMVTGRAPFQAATPMAVMIKHIHDPVPLLRTLNPEVPEALEQVTLKALHKQPTERFATAGEMVKALLATPERPLHPDEQETISIRTRAQPSRTVSAESPAQHASPESEDAALSETTPLESVFSEPAAVRRTPRRSAMRWALILRASAVVLGAFWLLVPRQAMEGDPVTTEADVQSPTAVTEPPATTAGTVAPPRSPAEAAEPLPTPAAESAATEVPVPSAPDERERSEISDTAAEARPSPASPPPPDTIRQDVADLLNQADGFVQQRDYDAAINRYEEALRLDSSDQAALAGLARARAAKARADATLAGILGARAATDQTDPREPIPTLLAEGQEALADRRFEAALEAFDAVLAIDQENTEATQGRNRALLGQQILGSRRPQP